MTVSPDAQGDRLDPSVWRISGVALFGALLAQLDATIVNVSLSNLAVDLNASLSTIQWVASGYLLALALVLPLSGWIVDRIGARALYIWGFAAFTLSSALCGLAWSAGALIGFRALQGISGGLLAPMAQMMVARAAGKHMARVAGFMSSPVLLAPLLGPIVAGAILQYASWRWLFLVNLPVGALALALAMLFLPEDRGETTRRGLDWFGLALLSPGLALFLAGSERIGAASGRWILAAGAAMIAAFVWWAGRKRDAALIDLRLFASRVFSAAIATQFLSNGTMFAGQMLVPAFLIQACGRTPAEMGWLLAPMGLGMMIAIPSMGPLTDRFGIRRVSAGGALAALAATLPLVVLAMRGFEPVTLALALFLRGLGLGAIGLPAISAAYATVSRKNLPMATTSANVIQRLGGPTLTTLCANFLAWRLAPQAMGDGASTAFAGAFVLLCLLHALTFAVALGLPLRREDVAVEN